MNLSQEYVGWCMKQGAGVMLCAQASKEETYQLEGKYERAIPSAGHHSYGQMTLINKICQYFQFNNVIEIGSLRGRSAYTILDSTPPTCKLHCIDTFQYSIDGKATTASYLETFKKNIDRFKSQITIWVDYSYNVAHQFHDGMFDAVFIDGDHSYEATFKDILLFYKKLRPGGIIFGHDYPHILDEANNFNGVLHAVNGLVRDRPDAFMNFGYQGGIWAAQYTGQPIKKIL